MNGGFYIYGIMREADLARVDPNLLFPGKEIGVVVKDHFGAVVAPTQEETFKATQEGLLGHFEVLSKLMSVGTVFPIRFGTVARSEEEIQSLLTSLSGMMDQTLQPPN